MGLIENLQRDKSEIFSRFRRNKYAELRPSDQKGTAGQRRLLRQQAAEGETLKLVQQDNNFQETDNARDDQ